MDIQKSHVFKHACIGLISSQIAWCKVWTQIKQKYRSYGGGGGVEGVVFLCAKSQILGIYVHNFLK